MNLCWLDDPACQDANQVGNKVANLSRVVGLASIPPGFCLTTSAFLRWQAEGCGERLPAELAEELATAYRQLSQRTGSAEAVVAVRSSAVGEDGPLASFAGQFETQLNRCGFAQLTAAVVACWQSAHAPQVAHYQEGLELPPHAPVLAVLVQSMVAAERSAVVFSANPVSGEHNEIVINATGGRGDQRVGGQLIPPGYAEYKPPRQIINGPGQNRPVGDRVTGAAVPAAQTERTALSDEQIMALASLAVQLEDACGAPVDLECAIRQETVYLLQCRPITALRETDHGQNAGEEGPAGQSVSADQLAWNRPEAADGAWNRGHTAVKPLQQSLSLYSYQGWAEAFRAVAANGGLQARFVNDYEYRRWQFSPQESWEAVEQAQQELAATLPQRWAVEWLPAIQADLARWRATDLTTLGDDELACHLHDLLNRQLWHWEIHAILGSAPLDAVQKLVDWYLQRFPNAAESEPYKLVQGQMNTTLAANHQLWRLSNEVNYGIAEALRGEMWSALPVPFAAAFASYLERYTDGLAASRSQAAQMILRYAEFAVSDPLVEMARLASEREAFTAEVRTRLNVDEEPLFERLLATALAHNPLTEDHNLYLDQQSAGATRRVCAEFGRRLAAYGILETAEECDFLSVYEMLQWGFGLEEPLPPLVVQRKAAYQQAQQRPPAAFLGRPPEPATWADRFNGPGAPLAAAAGALQGVGASAGVVAGPARVVHTLAEAFRLQPGEILVAPATDPRWTPLFALAAGLVTDYGGFLAPPPGGGGGYPPPPRRGTTTPPPCIPTG